MSDVTLTIKVKDGEVKDAAASVERLKKATDDLGKAQSAPERQTIGGRQAVDPLEQKKRPAERMRNNLPDAAQKASNAMSAVDDGLKAVEGASAGAQAGLSALAVGAGLVVGALAIVAAAAAAVVEIGYKLGGTAFDLSKQFADAGMQIDAAATAMGVSAQTASALQHEAERTGTSFDKVQSAAANLRKTIGEASAGNVAATASLRTLGIDGSKAIYDVDAAFKQAIATIVRARPGMDQIRAAYAAFGEEGYKLIPFFQSFNGNVDQAITRANELGIVMSGKDTDAAKQFTREFADARAAVTGLEYAFGRQLLPTVTNAINTFTRLLKDNRAGINDWATSVGNAVRGIIDVFAKLVKFTEDHPRLLKIAAGATRAAGAVASGGITEAAIVGYNTASDYGATLNNNNGSPFMPTIDYSRPSNAPDPAALDAARAAEKKQQEEMIKRAKENWDAAIGSWQNKGAEAGKELDDIFAKLKADFEKDSDAAKFAEQTDAAIISYVQKIKEARDNLNSLEDERDRRNNVVDNQNVVREQNQASRWQSWFDKEVHIATEATKLIQQTEKKANADALAEAETKIRREIELYDERDQTDAARKRIALAQNLITDQQYLDFQKKQDIDSLEFRQSKLRELLKFTGDNAKKRADIEGQISVVTEQIDRKRLENEERLTPILETQRDLRREINRLLNDGNNPDVSKNRQTNQRLDEQRQLIESIQETQDALVNVGANDGLELYLDHLQQVLDYRKQEFNAVLQIQRAQFTLDHQMDVSAVKIKAAVYQHLAEQKTLNDAIADGINKTYDAISQKMDDQIDKAFKWAGAFSSLFTEPLKAIARTGLSKLTSGLLDAFIPGLGKELTKTDNPIAAPIVDKLDDLNENLKLLVQFSGYGGGAATGMSFGGLNLGSLFGGSTGGGIFNFGGLSGMGTGSTPGGRYVPPTGTIHENGAYVVNGNQGSWLSNLQNLFSTKPGGIFGSQGFGNNVGTYGFFGAAAGLVGGLVGGRVGSAISMAGTGLALGAQIGSIVPVIGTAIGAAVGAIAGGLLGFFGFNDPKRKADHDENMPKLSQGFADATTQLRQILADLRSLNGDPDDLLSKARDIHNQIASGFGIQFQSKKYQQQSQDLIRQQLASIDAEPDGLMTQIIKAAEIARGAADRSKRILPEFAGGVFIDPKILRPNGLIPGIFDGSDTILSWLTQGEMVLNPYQQDTVRRRAGFDVFAGAGIPNYPSGAATAKLAGGGIANKSLSLSSSPIVVQPQFSLELYGVSVDDSVSAYLTSDTGLRQQIAINKKLKKRGDLN